MREKIRAAIQRTWFRHPLSLRADIGSDTFLHDAEAEPSQRRVGFAIYWQFDPGWHAHASRFMGVEVQLGPRVRWFGVRDSN